MNSRRKRIVFAAAILCCLSAGIVSEARSATVAVLMSDSLTSTTRTLQGAEKVVRRSGMDVELRTFFVGQGPEAAQRIVDSVRVLQPRAILTIGSAATTLAKESFTNVPIVFAGVMYPVLSGFVESNKHPGANITGASLDIPTEIQFRYFKMIIPDIKKIGVLYTHHTASLIPNARAVARGMGIELVAIEVRDGRQLPEALDSLANTVQGIWSVADPALFDPQATRYILLNTLRKGIPLMGFSRYVVESGALFALDFDYKAVGFQAGQILNRVLSGESPADISVSAADVIWFHYNEKTAQHIEVTIPEELVAVAKEVYR
jgi:putative ABC transport system substrate-binding protein